MRFIILLLLLSAKLYASDTLVIYSLPHKIRVEAKRKFVVSKDVSLKSQEITTSNFKKIIPDSVQFKSIIDSNYFSARNNEIKSLIEAFESNFKIHKITPSDSLLNWMNSLQSSKIMFIEAQGVTKKYKKETLSYIIDGVLGSAFLFPRYSYGAINIPLKIATTALGGFLLLRKKEPSFSIKTLVYDKKQKKFIYFESAGNYGEPLKEKLSEKVLKKSIGDFIKKGTNLNIK